MDNKQKSVMTDTLMSIHKKGVLARLKAIRGNDGNMFNILVRLQHDIQKLESELFEAGYEELKINENGGQENNGSSEV